MKVKIESTRTIKPIYEGISHSYPATPQCVPLSVFDKVTYKTHVAVIYAYRPPTPPNARIEFGLRRALSEYREWAGRLGENENGDPVIFLNDKGVKFVEASVDSKLDQVMPSKPSPELLSLHPSLKDAEELVQVQLTRFTCGSLVIGFTAHHWVADGFSTSNFLVNWGKASRGIEMDRLPLHDRTIFSPREHPRFEFEHRGAEFKTKKSIKHCPNDNFVADIVIHKVHFTFDFLSKLKARASSSLNGYNRPYSTFESLVAHLWRSIAKASGLDGFLKTEIRISVNGRTRMNPKIPNEYFGNLVLWACPKVMGNDLLKEPLSYAAKVIHDSVAKLNSSYFQSFIDFASDQGEEEDLVPVGGIYTSCLYPNLEVESWLKLPFNEFDFGGGSPYFFMPSYSAIDGDIFLLPSLVEDGSIDAFVPLFKDQVATFKEIIYSLD